MIRSDIIYFAKVNPNAKIPTKREEDGGYDIYACFEQDYEAIMPHETVLIPTGICSAFSSEYVAILKERGSTGTRGMGQRAGVIDSGFRNEWLCPITNENECVIVIMKECSKTTFQEVSDNFEKYGLSTIKYPYEKAICQFLLVPVPKVEVRELTVEEINKFSSDRGNGMLGSSGK